MHVCTMIGCTCTLHDYFCSLSSFEVPVKYLLIESKVIFIHPKVNSTWNRRIVYHALEFLGAIYDIILLKIHIKFSWFFKNEKTCINFLKSNFNTQRYSDDIIGIGFATLVMSRVEYFRISHGGTVRKALKERGSNNLKTTFLGNASFAMKNEWRT